MGKTGLEDRVIIISAFRGLIDVFVLTRGEQRAPVSSRTRHVLAQD